MQIKQFFEDDEAVSPVIGVILMVAITVILAAVIGTFVLGLGDQVQSTAPQTTWEFDLNDPASGSDTLTITHQSGDSVKAERLSLKSSSAYSADGGSSDSGTSNKFHEVDEISGTIDATTSIKSGMGIKASGIDGTDEDLTDQEFSIIWTSESGSNSATLQKWSGSNV